MLNIWPPLPIQILSFPFGAGKNVIAALEHRDRVHQITLGVGSLEVEKLANAMQEPFPRLTHLGLHYPVNAATPAAALPATFLGGSAESLQSLVLHNIPFPALPNLLSSTSGLVLLELHSIPNTGYFPPEALATGLSALTKLKALVIDFASSTFHLSPGARPPPPLTRAELPSLTSFTFRGVSDYLEDFVARIDAPYLRDVRIRFFPQPNFDIAQLSRLISYAGIPRSLNRAKMSFKDERVEIRLHQRGATYGDNGLQLTLPFKELNRKVSSMTQICTQALSLLSGVKRLDIVNGTPFLTGQANVDNRQWLGLFQPFTAVRTLCISRHLRSFIVSALQELTGEITTAVLPALTNLYLEGYESSGSEHEAMELFITARHSSGHAVAVHPWEGTSLRSWVR
jgi:hypothetical protein